MPKKVKKSATELTESSTIIGLGAGVVGQAGGNPAGLTALGGFLPPLGTVSGAGSVLDALGQLDSQKKKDKRI